MYIPASHRGSRDDLETWNSILWSGPFLFQCQVWLLLALVISHSCRAGQKQLFVAENGGRFPCLGIQVFFLGRLMVSQGVHHHDLNGMGMLFSIPSVRHIAIRGRAYNNR